MKKGFTLIELLIVVAIIVILAAIVVPGYIGVQKRAKRANVVAQAKALKDEIQNMLTAVYAASPTMASETIDWNGDGQINDQDRPPRRKNARAIVRRIEGRRYHAKPHNPYGSENVFRAGIIRLYPNNNNKTIAIKAYDDEGNLLYSETVSAE